MSRLELFVRGVPVPQGSKSARVMGQRAVLYDDNAAKLKPWREHVTACARIEMLRTGFRTLTGPVHVTALFIVERPAGHWGTGRNVGQLKRSAPEHPAVRPDVDKYLRAVLDSLTVAEVYADDGRVVSVEVVKAYGAQPGVRLRVEEAH